MKPLCALLLILLHVPPALIAQESYKQRSPVVMEPEVNLSGLDLSLRGTRLEALVRQRRWNEAGVLAEETVHQSPAKGSSWYALGMVRFNQRRFNEALRALRRAERLLPENAEVHRLLGLTYYLLEQYSLFEQQMEKGTAAQPQNGEFDYWLGRYYQQVAGDCARAISFFDRAISLNLASFKVLYDRGDCYDQAGDFALAEKDFTSAIEQIRKRSGHDSWPFQALARLYLRTDRVDEALSLAREAVRLEDGSDANHLILGKALTQKGDPRAAVAELRQAARLNPTGEAARYQLYRLYLRLDDRESAETELTAFREILAIYGESRNTR